MISQRLTSIARCPDCGGPLRERAAAGAATRPEVFRGERGRYECERCGRGYAAPDGTYLNLRPSASFAETTKYLDEALHADARHETVSPPLLSAAVRNDMLRAFLAPGPSDRVVDLGCGSGRALVWNAPLGAYQVGIDVSPHFARQALDTVDLIIGDLRKLPLADASFTKAFSLDVAEHLSRESLVEVLKEARRILAPGGALFLYTHVRKNSSLAFWLRWVNRIAHGLHRVGLISLSQEHLRKTDHLNPLADVGDFERVAAGAGFRIARIRYYTPVVGAVVENLLVRLAEGVMARRAKRRGAASGAGGDAASLRAARLDAKQRIERRGASYLALRALTRLMKLDILMFGRIRSGPFFALLIKDGS